MHGRPAVLDGVRRGGHDWPVHGRIRSGHAVALGWALAAGVALGGCRCGADHAAGPALRVWAPASLVDVLPKVAEASKAEGGPEVTFSFDATSRIARQVLEGAPADVFVAADRRWMDHVAARGEIVTGTRTEIARNRLVLIVPAATPAHGWKALDDVVAAGVHRLVLGGESVPVGRYAEAALRSAGVWKRLAPSVVRADHARAALAWVARGDAEAGIVYRTDAMADPRVRVAFTLPDDLHPPIVYVAAVTRHAAHPERAKRFVRLFGTPRVRALLRGDGFVPGASEGASP